VKSISIICAVFALTGCASSLVLSDDPLSGVPIYEPQLVRVITTTKYKPSPAPKDQRKVDLGICDSPKKSQDYKFLPLGKVRYVNFKPSHFGKGEFKVEYYDSGITKSVSLNSDPSAAVESANGLVSTILPYLGKPQFQADANDDRADNCLTESSSIEIEEMKVK
jgi:hypothetical protein